MDTPRSSISPQPPLQTETSPRTNSAGQESEDPFLAQTAAIPLTERDRQEGYDVELLNARPRGGGAYSSDDGGGDGDSLIGQRGEKYAGTAALSGGSTAAGTALPPAVGLAGLGAAEGGGLGGPGGGAMYGAGKEFRESGGGSGTTARTGRRRPWFLRPLPLGILIAFIVAVALAIGLGVGLSERSRHNSNSSAPVGTSAVSGGSRSRTRSGTRTSSATTGTVVPSSLYSSYTSEHPQSEESSLSSSITVVETSTDSAGEVTSITTIPSPASGTTLASTGNLPIPAGSATTISGSITVSRLDPSEATAASGATITARAKLRQRRWTA
ncbi:hypothetical protein JCM5350_003110 [Sporobolomyces pararoseus]